MEGCGGGTNRASQSSSTSTSTFTYTAAVSASSTSASSAAAIAGKGAVARAFTALGTVVEICLSTSAVPAIMRLGAVRREKDLTESTQKEHDHDNDHDNNNNDDGGGGGGGGERDGDTVVGTLDDGDDPLRRLRRLARGVNLRRPEDDDDDDDDDDNDDDPPPHRHPPPPPPRTPPAQPNPMSHLVVIRDEAWVGDTVERFVPLLTLCTPYVTSHLSRSVRRSASETLSAWGEKGVLRLFPRDARRLCLASLLTLAGDAMPDVAARAREGLVQGMRGATQHVVPVHLDPVPGHPRRIIYKREAFADKTIKKRRFSNIWTPNDCNSKSHSSSIQFLTNNYDGLLTNGHHSVNNT